MTFITRFAAQATPGGGGSTTGGSSDGFGSGGGGSFGSPKSDTSDCPGGTHGITNILPCTSNSSGGSIQHLLVYVVNFLALGVGLAVLAGIIFGGFLYASAGGSADQAKRGIGYVRNAIIALVIFIFMDAIINFIIPGGLF